MHPPKFLIPLQLLGRTTITIHKIINATILFIPSVIAESDAIANGLTKDYYKKVKQEITATNEAIKKGVMKGANVKRIPDFQSVK